MGRLDADRSHLPFLPLHRRDLDRPRDHASRRSIATILRRGAIIWGLGLLLAAFPFFQPLDGSRSPACWRASRGAMCRRRSSRERSRHIPSGGESSARSVVASAVALLDPAGGGPVPGRICRRPLTRGNIGAWLDRTLFGAHLWRGGRWDPEGLLSTVPAIATTMIGLIAGWFIAETIARRARSCAGSSMWGLVGVLLGLFTSQWLPDQQESLDELIRAVHRRPRGRCARGDVTGSATRADRRSRFASTEPLRRARAAMRSCCSSCRD